MATLLIKNDGIGDLILSSGLIADVARECGPLDLITCEANREIAESIPGLRKRLYVSRDGIYYHQRLLKLGIHWRRRLPLDDEVFKHLTVTEYDLAICLRRYIRQSALLLMQAVQARRRHCAWRWCTDATFQFAEQHSLGWERYTGAHHADSELTYYRLFLRESLKIHSNTPPSLSITEGIHSQPEQGRVGVCLSGPDKNWPHQNWISLSDNLISMGYTLVLFGGPDAIKRGQEISQRHPSIINHINSLTFSASVPEIARLDLLISNDTAFAHFASIVANRVLVIMGGGTYKHFFPWPEAERQFTIVHGLNCWGCNWACHLPRMECFHRISPQSVMRYISEIINAPPQDRFRNVGEAFVGCSKPSNKYGA